MARDPRRYAANGAQWRQRREASGGDELESNTKPGEALEVGLEGKDDPDDLQGEDSAERVFLLGRLLFLVTVDQPEEVKALVEKEEAVEGLTYVSGLTR